MTAIRIISALCRGSLASVVREKRIFSMGQIGIGEVSGGKILDLCSGSLP